MGKLQFTKEQIAQIGAGVLFTALFIYVYGVYFWLPISAKIAVDSKKVDSMQSDITMAKMQKAKYKDLEAKLSSLEAEKEAAQKMLPKERKFPELIKTLTTLSKKYKVNIQSIVPNGNTKGEYFTKAAYQITASGDYHSIGKFLTALGLEERILTMENLVLSATPGSETSAYAAFTLMVYQYNG